MELDIKGHSGCVIDVRREGYELMVYKSTRDPKYLNRLELQARKQQTAALKHYHHIRVPAIHSVERSDESVVIKMDYVYSRNFIEHLEQSGFEQIGLLSQALIDFVEKEIAESKMTTIPATVLTDKFANVKSITLANALLNGDSEIHALLDVSEQVFNSLDTLHLPLGVCHGDLTFSNILFSGNNYYLIDFLDSFIESPMLDIVKLRQDTAFRWSQLMYTKRFDEIRLRIVMEKIDEMIDRYFDKKYEWYSATYRPLQLMNFLRILQYAHEQQVVNYLKTTIRTLLQ